MTNPYWQRQHQRYMTGGGVSGRYPKQQEQSMTEQIIKVDVAEAIKLAEAAQAMLAALKVAWHEMRHTTATRSSFTDALDAVDAAIAQAEAAGIKAEG